MMLSGKKVEYITHGHNCVIYTYTDGSEAIAYL
jgi:hypothetical protein